LTETAGKARTSSCFRPREWFEKPPKKQQATALTFGSKFDNDGEMEEFTQNVETLADLNKPIASLLLYNHGYGAAVKGTTVMQSLIVPTVAHCVVDN